MKSIEKILLILTVALFAVSCDRVAETRKAAEVAQAEKAIAAATAEEAAREAADARAEIEAHKKKSGSSPGPALKPKAKSGEAPAESEKPAEGEKEKTSQAAPPEAKIEEKTATAPAETEEPAAGEKEKTSQAAPPEAKIEEKAATAPAETEKPAAGALVAQAAPAGAKVEEKTAAANAAAAAGPGGGDWLQWGRNGSNNMMSPASEISAAITAGEIGEDGNVTGAQGARWVVKLGSQAYGTPTIHQGRVFVGTNNEEPRLETVIGDRGIVLCFDEKKGDLQWQFSIPKLGAGKVSDWEFLGICSSILLDGKHGYVVSNRGEIICLDLYGMSDGNDGPFQDEGRYMVGGLEKLDESEPVEVGDKDADVVWGYDMRTDLGVFPHNITSSSVVLAGDKIFASTSNGVDWSHINIPAPVSPCLIALDKETGELVGEEASGIGERVMHCNWSSPGYAENLNGKATVVFGAGDGWTYGFDANDFDVEEDGGEKYYLMKELWKVDCCPTNYRYTVEALTETPDEAIAEAVKAIPGVDSVKSTPVDEDKDETPESLKLEIVPTSTVRIEALIEAISAVAGIKSAEAEAIKYATYPGPSEIISSPVVHNNKVYACIGQDPEHGEGLGCVTCIDPSKGNGADAVVWQFKEIGRTISTPSIADGLLFIADYSGRLFCLDAETGEKYWEFDTLSHIWGSTLVADGKVFLGNEDGELIVIKATKDADADGNGEITRLKKDSKTGEIIKPEETLDVIEYPAPIFSTCVVANGTLYVMTQTHLYAYGK